MVKLTAPADLYVAALGVDVAAGDELEVDDELGARLAEQGWTLHTSSGSRPARKRAPKAAAKRAPKRAALKAAGTDTDTDTGPASAGPDTSSAPADDPEV